MAVAHDDGRPVVIANAPLLDDGRPMPTRYWLVDVDLRRRVSQLEGDGGVRAAEAAVDPEALAAAHDRYASERDALVPPDHRGPRPTGGVGGTARGVKCLHAHLAYRLAGGDDPVGGWVMARLGDIGVSSAVESTAAAPAPDEHALATGSGEPAPAFGEPARASVRPELAAGS
ncbi:DUF501 domain-containing protein [Candidatus Poriferisodalis sp.]|uniref:DUF501 domain-containing protein n=1 Tax=Candidatus Poriferisodalis sp. TaxID=3101277 RepID=UPI003B021178